MNDIRNPENLWTVQKAKLKLLFTHLDDEDFHYDYGKKDVMLALHSCSTGPLTKTTFL